MKMRIGYRSVSFLAFLIILLCERASADNSTNAAAVGNGSITDQVATQNSSKPVNRVPRQQQYSYREDDNAEDISLPKHLEDALSNSFSGDSSAQSRRSNESRSAEEFIKMVQGSPSAPESPVYQQEVLFDGGSKIIEPNSYVRPNLIKGAENVVRCKVAGELHYFWTHSSDCLVCACINDRHHQLSPVCASCRGCMVTTPTDELDAPNYIPTRPPDVDLVTDVYVPIKTCDPLPTNEPFQNPLNPCQICVCQHTISHSGVPDVQIICEENPKCLLPTEFPPAPTPTPEISPENPTSRRPFYPSIPETTLRRQFPYYTSELEVIEHKKKYKNTNPLTWPPLKPLPEGPLPGPKPHKSCRPYPPDTPFQHPWDSCLACVCSEHKQGPHTDIEVNCFTKKECCIMPPKPLPPPKPPKPVGPFTDPMCRYKPLHIEFLHPSQKCRLCVCERFGHYIVPRCYRSNKPECQAPKPKPPSPPIMVIFLEPACKSRPPSQNFVISCDMCACNLVFQYVIAQCQPRPNCGGGGGMIQPIYNGGLPAFAPTNLHEFGSNSYKVKNIQIKSAEDDIKETSRAAGSGGESVQVLNLKNKELPSGINEKLQAASSGKHHNSANAYTEQPSSRSAELEMEPQSVDFKSAEGFEGEASIEEAL